MSNDRAVSKPAETVRFLRISEITKRFPISKPTIYRLAKEGLFPKPVKVGSSSWWVENEIEQWLAERLAARETC